MAFKDTSGLLNTIPHWREREIKLRGQIDKIVEKYESVMKAMQEISKIIKSTSFAWNTNVPTKYRKVHQILIDLIDHIATALKPIQLLIRQ